MRKTLALTALLLVGCTNGAVSEDSPGQVTRWQEESTSLRYSRTELQAHWRQRIQGIVDSGTVPLIDMESSIGRDQLETYLPAGLKAMDELGLALIAFDGYQAKKKADSPKGYRPSYYTNQLVNAYPERFIPTTNGGTNNNWLKERDSFVEYLVHAVANQPNALIGELEFRHYMSSQQCRQGRYDRDIDISLLGDNGRAVFTLSNETGIPVVIHLEAEDTPLEELEAVLQRYPNARVIVAHFGQIRHPERQRGFTPQWVRRMLMSYPNLYYDLSVGGPGRRYACNNDVLDTVLWKTTAGGQSNELDPQWQAILTQFSQHFVAGTDYGGGRPALPKHLRNRVGNLRLILSQLPAEAQHNIGYRNAWRLLTGEPWTRRMP